MVVFPLLQKSLLLLLTLVFEDRQFISLHDCKVKLLCNTTASAEMLLPQVCKGALTKRLKHLHSYASVLLLAWEDQLDYLPH